MAVAGTLNSADFGVCHGPTQPKPTTQVCALTITPTARFTFLSGQVQLANLVPPQPDAYCEVVLCFTHGAPGAMLTNGALYPIKVGYQPITLRPILMCWDPVSAYWWPAAVV
jgi:hypothetical protein